MDENKEKELQGEEVEENSAETLSEQEKEEVGKIIDQMKNSEETKTITDWDGLAQVGDSAEELIEEADAEESEEADAEEISEEINEDELCIRCGKRKRYTELDEDYPYCKACREDMKKTPMNPWGIVAVIVTALFGVIATLFGTFIFLTTAPYIKGDIFMKEGNYRSAITSYQEVISQTQAVNQVFYQNGVISPTDEPIIDVSSSVYARIVKAFYESGMLISAQDYFNVLEETGDLEKAKFKEIKEMKEIFDLMLSTDSEVTKNYQELMRELVYAEEKKDIKDIQKHLDDIEKLKSDKKYDKHMLAYIQFYICQYVNNSENQQIKYLEEVKSGGKAYQLIWQSSLPMAYLKAGDFEKAEKISNEVLEDSPEMIEAYQFLMKTKIRQNDPKAALELFDKALETMNNIYVVGENELTMPYTLWTEKATAHALLGQKDEALAAINESYTQGADVHSVNVYTLLHYVYCVEGTEPKEANGGKIYDNVDSGYDIGLSLFASNGMKVSKEVQDVIDGKREMEDVLVNGEAYLQ